MASVAVLGLGAMGSRVALALSAAEHVTTGWTRSPARRAGLGSMPGVRLFDDAREAVAGADVIVVIVRDDDASRDVWGQVGGWVRPGTLWVESSTLSPERSVEFCTMASAAGGVPCVAPMVGSRPQAEQGDLVFVLGGEPSARERATALLRSISQHVVSAGTAAEAAAVKLTINAMLAVQAALLAELIPFVGSAVESADLALDIITGLPVVSPAAQGLLRRMRQRAFAANFPVELVTKDLGYFVDRANALGAAVPLTRVTRDLFERLSSTPAADLDIASVADAYQHD